MPAARRLKREIKKAAAAVDDKARRARAARSEAFAKGLDDPTRAALARLGAVAKTAPRSRRARAGDR